MKSGTRWPVAIVAVLGLTVIVNIGVMVLANDRQAAVVEPDYYSKGVRWDSTLAAERHDREIGWSLEAELGPVGSDGSELVARLTGRDARPIEGAAVRVTAIHNLEAATPRTATLEPAGGGRYRACLPIRRPGLWELRFEVARGHERFTETLRRDAARRVPATTATAAAREARS